MSYRLEIFSNSDKESSTNTVISQVQQSGAQSPQGILRQHGYIFTVRGLLNRRHLEGLGMDVPIVEKSVISWETKKVSVLGLTTKTFLIRIPRLPNIICLVICDMSNEEADYDEFTPSVMS
jgi:hypothetical protein